MKLEININAVLLVIILIIRVQNNVLIDFLLKIII